MFVRRILFLLLIYIYIHTSKSTLCLGGQQRVRTTRHTHAALWCARGGRDESPDPRVCIPFEWESERKIDGFFSLSHSLLLCLPFVAAIVRPTESTTLMPTSYPTRMVADYGIPERKGHIINTTHRCGVHCIRDRYAYFLEKFPPSSSSPPPPRQSKEILL